MMKCMKPTTKVHVIQAKEIIIREQHLYHNVSTRLGVGKNNPKTLFQQGFKQHEMNVRL